MSTQKMMTIPAPKAKPGQRVVVLNYYLRPAREVYGDVYRARYELGEGRRQGHWSYDVGVDGRAEGISYRIYVGDKSIVEVIGPTPQRVNAEGVPV